ncbi:MAG TPA: hypothetical protein DEG43_17215 [Acidimicrobiaceae bacterium]|nr:hypothetical protein [Acidimicrobiaceae bacterium]
MSRRCARPGCQRPAIATLSYNYGDGVVIIEDLHEHAHPMVHDLCAFHADRLSVPLGWACHDSRQVVTFGTSKRNRQTA